MAAAATPATTTAVASPTPVRRVAMNRVRNSFVLRWRINSRSSVTQSHHEHQTVHDVDLLVSARGQRQRGNTSPRTESQCDLEKNRQIACRRSGLKIWTV